MNAGVAPEAWVRYAEGATGEIAIWLRDDSEISVRLRGYLNEISVARGEPATIELRLWIGADGTIQRVAFPPFTDAQANADLKAAVIGRRLAAPPAGILFPLRIAVEVKPE